jgi:hypothetical protein
MGVTALAYVTFDVADPAYWRDIYTGIFDAVARPRGRDDRRPV